MLHILLNTYQNLVVIIIKKIKDNSFKRKETDAYKPKDAINPLYSILLVCYLLL